MGIACPQALALSAVSIVSKLRAGDISLHAVVIEVIVFCERSRQEYDNTYLSSLGDMMTTVASVGMDNYSSAPFRHWYTGAVVPTSIPRSMNATYAKHGSMNSITETVIHSLLDLAIPLPSIRSCSSSIVQKRAIQSILSPTAQTNKMPPKRVNKIRYPREFLLEDGGRISWLTTEPFESVKGREVTRTGSDGKQFEKRIVEEITTKEVLEKIAAAADAESDVEIVCEPRVPRTEAKAGGPDDGSDGDEENDSDEDDDYLPPCEGTFPICCAADLSPEVSQFYICPDIVHAMSCRSTIPSIANNIHSS